VGLLVAAAVLDDVHVNAGSFFVAVLIFTIVFALMQPFLVSQFRRGNNAAALGGVALIATLAALIVTDILSDGFSIDGVFAWIAATFIVWLGAVLAAFILPFLGLRKFLEERRE
jgi:uncharacterized membrane protein YvlD (DUF360 family)